MEVEVCHCLSQEPTGVRSAVGDNDGFQDIGPPPSTMPMGGKGMNDNAKQREESGTERSLE